MQFCRANQTVSHFDQSLLGCCGSFAGLFDERTFSKLPKVIQVQWKLPKQKDFNVLIYFFQPK